MYAPRRSCPTLNNLYSSALATHHFEKRPYVVAYDEPPREGIEVGPFKWLCSAKQRAALASNEEPILLFHAVKVSGVSQSRSATARMCSFTGLVLPGGFGNAIWSRENAGRPDQNDRERVLHARAPCYNPSFQRIDDAEAMSEPSRDSTVVHTRSAIGIFKGPFLPSTRFPHLSMHKAYLRPKPR